MLLSVENSFGTLENHLRTYRILTLVLIRLEVAMLLWNNQYRPEIFDSLVLVRVYDRFLDVGPDIRSIVPIKVDELFQHYILEINILRKWNEFLLGKIFLSTRLGNLIQVLLISVVPDDVNGLVEIGTRMLVTIFLSRCCENIVIGDFEKIKLYLGLSLLVPHDLRCCLHAV